MQEDPPLQHASMRIPVELLTSKSGKKLLRDTHLKFLKMSLQPTFILLYDLWRGKMENPCQTYLTRIFPDPRCPGELCPHYSLKAKLLMPLLNLLYSFFSLLSFLSPIIPGNFFFSFPFSMDPHKRRSLQPLLAVQLNEDSDHLLMHLLMGINFWNYWLLVVLRSI